MTRLVVGLMRLTAEGLALCARPFDRAADGLWRTANRLMLWHNEGPRSGSTTIPPEWREPSQGNPPAIGRGGAR